MKKIIALAIVAGTALLLNSGAIERTVGKDNATDTSRAVVLTTAIAAGLLIASDSNRPLRNEDEEYEAWLERRDRDNDDRIRRNRRR